MTCSTNKDASDDLRAWRFFMLHHMPAPASRPPISAQFANKCPVRSRHIRRSLQMPLPLVRVAQR